MSVEETVTQPDIPSALDEPIGPRLRRLRRLRGATLNEVAREVGISHSFLSMLERGKADVSLSRLARLAAIYGVTLSELFAEEGPGVEPVVLSNTDMSTVDRGPGIEYHYWTPAPLSGVQLIHVRFEPRAAFRDLLAHRGEDFVWIVRGELTLLYGNQEYQVKAGDAVVYAASVPHAYRNDSAKVSELMAFTSPPYW